MASFEEFEGAQSFFFPLSSAFSTAEKSRAQKPTSSAGSRGRQITTIKFAPLTLHTVEAKVMANRALPELFSHCDTSLLRLY